MPTLTELQLTFLDSLARDKQRQSATVASYRRSLERFTAWLQQKTTGGEVAPQEITAERLRGFGRWLKAWKQPNGGTLSAAAQNYHLSALRSFLSYLHTTGLTALSAIHVPLLKPERQAVAVLSSAELARLLEAPTQTNESLLVQLRDRALLELLLATGLKTAEVARLERSARTSTNDELKVAQPTSSQRTVKLSHQARFHLERYLSERKDATPALFVRHDRAGGQSNQPLTPRSIQRSLEHYRKVANISKRLTPGSLRHAFAARLLQEGADHKTVSASLGHRHPTTLKLYHYQAPEV